MYRVTVVCGGLTEAEGSGAVACILDEFTHRPWHKTVACEWRDGILWLSASNDYDQTGQALLDEFGDAIIACVSPVGSIRSKVEAVVAQ